MKMRESSYDCAAFATSNKNFQCKLMFLAHECPFYIPTADECPTRKCKFRQSISR